MSKHTLGPWTVEDDKRFDHIRAANRQYVAVTYTGNPADAHLIAAAPDLLAALQGVMPIVERWMRECDEKYGDGWLYLAGTPTALDEARAALAKATGDDANGRQPAVQSGEQPEGGE
jgi:hypothetical protein